MLLAVAVWILSPVLPPLAGMLSWSLLAFGVALLLRRSWIAAALPVVVGIAILVGALAGQPRPAASARRVHRRHAALGAGGLDARRVAGRAASPAQGAGQDGDARLLCRLVRLVQGNGGVHFLRPEGARAARPDAAAAGGRHRQQRARQGAAQALLAVRTAGDRLLRRRRTRDQGTARDRLPERRERSSRPFRSRQRLSRIHARSTSGCRRRRRA